MTAMKSLSFYANKVTNSLRLTSPVKGKNIIFKPIKRRFKMRLLICLSDFVSFNASVAAVSQHTGITPELTIAKSNGDNCLRKSMP